MGEDEVQTVGNKAKSKSFSEPSGKLNLLAKQLFSSSFPAHYLKRHFSWPNQSSSRMQITSIQKREAGQ